MEPPPPAWPGAARVLPPGCRPPPDVGHQARAGAAAAGRIDPRARPAGHGRPHPRPLRRAGRAPLRRACGRRSCTATWRSTTCCWTSRNRVAGIVDFGDIVHTSLVTDLAAALASVLRGRDPDDVFRSARLMLDGYQSVTPLEPLELELVGDLLAARLAAIVTISAWRVLRYPENAEYIPDWDADTLGDDRAVRRSGRRRCVRSELGGSAAAGRRRRARAFAGGAALGAAITPPTYARAGARRPPAGRLAVRGRRPAGARRLQQRPGGRPLPPARDRGGRPPDARR